ncbi:hypothetical protein O7632_01015 [Solwaraspora sp. WMMD406]|uniref:hypothetical protein n=1 Tax=Solwaraspora sp. WMMD406 TaxID=3016095 RepID=UPI0024171809|nr:hypothetical protein [Solwaraspora sp. WMMD406]MDG4762702.1 hypothetical protein [Solwaraspora sp. WMMD406]
MRGAQLAELTGGTPAGVPEALAVVDGFDQVLVGGLGRLAPQQAAALAELAGAVASTPLGAAVAEAVDKVAAGSIGDEQLLRLAGARTAILGATHDALRDRLDTALGRTRDAWTATTTPAGTVDGRLLAARSWLAELVITGWRNVDHDLVSTSQQALHALLAEPALRRCAVLLDGFAAELAYASPVATMDRLPVRRWADLWTRSMLATSPPDQPAAPEPVSGRLLPLGVDVHEHSTAVQLQVHALLETDGGPAGDAAARLVRVNVSAAKVDTIVGPALWQLFAEHPVLLAALAGRLSLDVTDLPLHPGGDLVWRDDQARPGTPADPFAAARVRLGDALAPAVPPLDRHPATIAEPVLLDGYTVDTEGGLTFDLDGTRIAVDVDRLPGCGPLTADLVAASTACVGLLRWDDAGGGTAAATDTATAGTAVGGGWSVQPTGVQTTVKRKKVDVHTGDWAQGPTDPKVAKAVARSGDTIAVLRERAGRLLRK